MSCQIPHWRRPPRLHDVPVRTRRVSDPVHMPTRPRPQRPAHGIRGAKAQLGPFGPSLASSSRKRQRVWKEGRAPPRLPRKCGLSCPSRERTSEASSPPSAPSLAEGASAFASAASGPQQTPRGSPGLTSSRTHSSALCSQPDLHIQRPWGAFIPKHTNPTTGRQTEPELGGDGAEGRGRLPGRMGGVSGLSSDVRGTFPGCCLSHLGGKPCSHPFLHHPFNLAR